MGTFSKEFMSTGGGGEQFLITETAFADAETVHTVPASVKDIVEIWASNQDSLAVDLSLLWGGSSATENLITVNIPPGEGLTCIIPGLTLDAAKVVKVWAGTTLKVSVFVEIKRIT